MKRIQTLLPVSHRQTWRSIYYETRQVFHRLRYFKLAIWVGLVGFHVLAMIAISGSAMVNRTNATLSQDTIQSVFPREGLKVGDTVPDIEVRHIVNYQTKTAKISDFKGKLLILDFWTTWCSSCLGSFPKLDSLQQQFKGRLVVLPVTSQSAKIAEPVLRKKAKSLPSVTQDTLLGKLFPYKSVPHHVWVLDGVVYSITGHYSATAANVSAVLAKKQVDMVSKSDNMSFDPGKPLMYRGNGGIAEKLNYQSMITGYMAGLGYRTVLKNSIIQVTNSTPEQLFQKALINQYPWLAYQNRILIKGSQSIKSRVSPPSGISREEQERWLIENGVCYNLFWPNVEKQVLEETMYTDLNRFFSASMGIRAGVETVRTTCLILKRKGTNRLESRGGVSSSKLDSGRLVINNRPFRILFNALAFQLSKQPLPLLDETGFSGNIDVETDLQMNDIEALQKKLGKLGFRLLTDEREIEMLVIRETNPGKKVVPVNSSNK